MKRPMTWILIFALSLCFFAGCTSRHTQTSLLEFTGEPAIWSAKNESALQPKAGLRLQQSDSIKTADSDSVWLRFGIDQTAVLERDSELIIQAEPGCDLRAGLLLCRIDKPLKEDRLFGVQAADTLLTTKSAVFSAQLLPSGELYVNVFQGEVTLDTADTSTKLGKGQAIRLTTDTGAPPNPPATIDYNALPASLAPYIGDYARESLLMETPPPQAAPESNASIPDEPSRPESISSPPPESSSAADLHPESSDSSDSESSRLPDRVDWEPAVYQPPQVRFSYQWFDDSYRPFADIRWKPGGEKSYINWQLYNSSGRAVGASGRIDCPGGSIREDNYRFNAASPTGNALFPKGYTLRLTAYAVDDDDHTELDPVIMQLPYYEITENDEGQPIPDTNIGVYFVHNYGGITISQQQQKLLVVGKLSPLKGRDVPLEMNLAFDWN